ncbi:hypothetical protein [Chryseobacterium sp. EO14]|uniref:hypothetical protein n=1 Tax=Chryseobacterium sp. EO14 TaxID=2950551 RepID=UPI00210DC06B|nr:hypothetical protein [Chryseobacterium sp. EO14]MCQ4139210.1 hypothetical protein [Chryseobacterium sp. EO14]
MANHKLDITDDIIGIYVEKFLGEKLRVIQKKYNIKCHSAIYFYCSIVEERSQFDRGLREKIQKKKDELKRQRPLNYIQLSFSLE